MKALEGLEKTAQGLPLARQEVGMKLAMRIAAALGVCALVACTTKVGPQGPAGAPGPSAAPGAAAAPVPAAGADGATSGGGGWVTRNSQRVIDAVKLELSTKVRNGAPEIFSRLPEGWDQEKIARLIEGARLSPHLEDPNHGGDRMMSWGSDERGPFVQFLRPFFWAYSAVPMGERNARTRELINDVEIQVLHEIAHHWVGGDPDARSERIARELFAALSRNVVLCKQTTSAEMAGGRFFPIAFHRSFIGLPNFQRMSTGQWVEPLFEKLKTGDVDRFEAWAGTVRFPVGVESSGPQYVEFRTGCDSSERKRCPGRLRVDFDGRRGKGVLRGQLMHFLEWEDAHTPILPGGPQPPPPKTDVEFSCEQIALTVEI